MALSLKKDGSLRLSKRFGYVCLTMAAIGSPQLSMSRSGGMVSDISTSLLSPMLPSPIARIHYEKALTSSTFDMELLESSLILVVSVRTSQKSQR